MKSPAETGISTPNSSNEEEIKGNKPSFRPKVSAKLYQGMGSSIRQDNQNKKLLDSKKEEKYWALKSWKKPKAFNSYSNKIPYNEDGQPQQDQETEQAEQEHIRKQNQEWEQERVRERESEQGKRQERGQYESRGDRRGPRGRRFKEEREKEKERQEEEEEEEEEEEGEEREIVVVQRNESNVQGKQGPMVVVEESKDGSNPANVNGLLDFLKRHVPEKKVVEKEKKEYRYSMEFMMALRESPLIVAPPGLEEFDAYRRGGAGGGGGGEGEREREREREADYRGQHKRGNRRTREAGG
ncbi:hypothetical protein AX774_g1515, partial [Zancudomyces culisetae]